VNVYPDPTTLLLLLLWVVVRSGHGTQHALLEFKEKL
jgi:hypothetical protein